MEEAGWGQHHHLPDEESQAGYYYCAIPAPQALTPTRDNAPFHEQGV